MLRRTHWSDGVVPKYDVVHGRMSGMVILAEALPDSDECKEVSSLLDQMLSIQPHARFPAYKLLQNPWLSRNHV